MGGAVLLLRYALARQLSGPVRGLQLCLSGVWTVYAPALFALRVHCAPSPLPSTACLLSSAATRGNFCQRSCGVEQSCKLPVARS